MYMAYLWLIWFIWLLLYGLKCLIVWLGVNMLWLSANAVVFTPFWYSSGVVIVNTMGWLSWSVIWLGLSLPASLSVLTDSRLWPLAGASCGSLGHLSCCIMLCCCQSHDSGVSQSGTVSLFSLCLSLSVFLLSLSLSLTLFRMNYVWYEECLWERLVIWLEYFRWIA